MRALHTPWIAALILITLSTGGCGTAGSVAGDESRDASDRSSADLEAIFRARQDSALTRFTEADVQFMTGMIAHHAQAVAMVALAPTHGAGPEVRTLAARIDNAQRDEIATMQSWLRERGQPVPEIQIDGIDVTVHVDGDNAAHEGDDHAAHESGDRAMHGSDHHAMHMPGMLTPEQLHHLNEARGGQFDRLFLEYMIQHHAGAVTMVEVLFNTDGAVQDEAAFRFASDVQVDQATEVDRMKRMLETLPRSGGDP